MHSRFQEGSPEDVMLLTALVAVRSLKWFSAEREESAVMNLKSAKPFRVAGKPPRTQTSKYYLANCKPTYSLFPDRRTKLFY